MDPAPRGTKTVVENTDAVPSFVARVVRRALEEGARPGELLSAAIAEIDARLQAQVQAILHAGPFRRLESAWSSLEYVVAAKPQDTLVRIRVLNVSRDEILADLEDAVEFDRSALFQHIYEHEFGQYGGEPYAILVSDLAFANDPEDLEILSGLSGIAAAAHAILLASPSPELLGLDSWSQLSVFNIPEQIAGRGGFNSWQALRETSDTRYIGLVMPGILLRRPYRPDDPDRLLRLREDASAGDGSGLSWGSGAYALAERAMSAFHAFGWCTAIRGLVDGAGVVEGLPEISCATDKEGLVVPPPVEVAVTESQEKSLTELGLIPLCRVAGTSQVSFFGVPSLHQPRRVDDPMVATNLKLSAQVPYMLAASRFAHYLKVIMRDRVGQFTSRDEVQRDLANWLARYTLEDDDATLERQAQYPLRSYHVAVREKPGRPGELEAITQLRPHYQVEDPGVTLRLAVELPDPDKTQR